MGRVNWTDRARADVDQIAFYISRDNPTAAFRWVDSLRGKLELLASFPGMGRDRSELRPGMRSLPFGNYVVYYRPLSDGIMLIRVIHGARDVGPLFAEE